jgi:ABC-type nitrate/sulfonate/bicarbonate transport system substrate-binding protein
VNPGRIMIQRRCVVACTLVLLLSATAPAQAADKVVAAVNRLSAGAPLYIAKDKGFFAEEDLDVALMHLTSSQAIGLAVASGDAQFGMTAITRSIPASMAWRWSPTRRRTRRVSSAQPISPARRSPSRRSARAATTSLPA